MSFHERVALELDKRQQQMFQINTQTKQNTTTTTTAPTTSKRTLEHALDEALANNKHITADSKAFPDKCSGAG